MMIEQVKLVSELGNFWIQAAGEGRHVELFPVSKHFFHERKIIAVARKNVYGIDRVVVDLGQNIHSQLGVHALRPGRSFVSFEYLGR